MRNAKVWVGPRRVASSGQLILPRLQMLRRWSRCSVTILCVRDVLEIVVVHFVQCAPLMQLATEPRLTTMLRGLKCKSSRRLSTNGDLAT